VLLRDGDGVLGTHRSRSRAVSEGELLRRTLRVDHPDRGHRPDADLRRAAPASGACRVRRALQHRAAASSAAVAAAAPAIVGSRAGSWQDPPSTDPGRTQRVRGCSLKPLVSHHGGFWHPTGTGSAPHRPVDGAVFGVRSGSRSLADLSRRHGRFPHDVTGRSGRAWRGGYRRRDPHLSVDGSEGRTTAGRDTGGFA